MIDSATYKTRICCGRSPLGSGNVCPPFCTNRLCIQGRREERDSHEEVRRDLSLYSKNRMGIKEGARGVQLSRAVDTVRSRIGESHRFASSDFPTIDIHLIYHA